MHSYLSTFHILSWIWGNFRIHWNDLNNYFLYLSNYFLFTFIIYYIIPDFNKKRGYFNYDLPRLSLDNNKIRSTYLRIWKLFQRVFQEAEVVRARGFLSQWHQTKKGALPAGPAWTTRCLLPFPVPHSTVRLSGIRVSLRTLKLGVR